MARRKRLSNVDTQPIPADVLARVLSEDARLANDDRPTVRELPEAGR